jgi:hypothetical protein
MSSAACYTNRRRVKAESKLSKIQYPRGIATRNVYLTAENCKPDYSELTYVWRFNCVCRPTPPSCIQIYNGGNSNTVTYIILDGGNAPTNVSNVYSGGTSTTSACTPSILNTLVFSGGNAGTNSSNTYDGNS